METAKLPIHMPKLSWADKRDAKLAALTSETPGSGTKSRPTTVRSFPRYDGTTPPGDPGEPV